ncbi:MAG: hypothetical protein WAK36_04995, partial [Pseudolabrys sp.]
IQRTLGQRAAGWLTGTSRRFSNALVAGDAQHIEFADEIAEDGCAVAGHLRQQLSHRCGQLVAVAFAGEQVAVSVERHGCGGMP